MQAKLRLARFAAMLAVHGEAVQGVRDKRMNDSATLWIAIKYQDGPFPVHFWV